MAHRSQCSSAGDNPLDPNYLPPHYREEYRLAIDALIEENLEGYYKFLQNADVVDFLSRPEIEYIQSTIKVPRESSHQPEHQRYLECDLGDGSSDTYWPIHSDLDAPGLDLGWPQQHRFIGPTEVTTLVNPAEPDMPTIKEQARRLIKNAQQVVAIVMDMFTDVDIFADLINATMRNVAVYVLLDEQNVHHFVNMVSNCRVNLESIQFLRVRTVSGITYHCRSGKTFKGQMMDRFLLTDCRAVLSGNYSFMWSFEKIHRCLAHLFLGQLVCTFDEEFRILYAQSQPLIIENVLAGIEDFSLVPEGQYITDNALQYQDPRMSRSREPSCPDEWKRQPFDDRVDMDWKNMPLSRHDSIQRSRDPPDMYMYPSQQLRMDQPYEQGHSRMPVNLKDSPTLKRHSYAEGTQGRHPYQFMQQQGLPSFETEGKRFYREQHPFLRTGPETGYSGIDKFRGPGHQPSDQYPESGLPQDLESDSFDPVLHYLSSTSNVEMDRISDKILHPGEASPRLKRSNVGQPYACQTSPTVSNQPDQKMFFEESNMDRKDPKVKQGLRNWRICSYLSAHDDDPGDKETPVPLPAMEDPFEESSYSLKRRSSGPELSVPKIPIIREFKVPPVPRASQLPSYMKPTLTDPSKKIPDDFVTMAAETKKTSTPSESSSTTDRSEELEPKEPKDTVVRRESFRRQVNPAVQRSSRLRSSLIFSSQLEQQVPQDSKTASGQADEETDKKEGDISKLPFASRVMGQRRSFAKEPVDWTRYIKSATFDTPDTDPTKADDKDLTSQNKSQDLPERMQIKESSKLAEGPAKMSLSASQFDVSQIESPTVHPPTSLISNLSYVDMNDPDSRLMFFKELAAKRKAEKAAIKPPPESKTAHSFDEESAVASTDSEKIELKSNKASVLSHSQSLEDPKLPGPVVKECIPFHRLSVPTLTDPTTHRPSESRPIPHPTGSKSSIPHHTPLEPSSEHIPPDCNLSPDLPDKIEDAAKPLDGEPAKISASQPDLSHEMSPKINKPVHPPTSLMSNLSLSNLSYVDMNDPENRLMYFKELAAKRKATMAAEAPNSTEKADINPPSESKIGITVTAEPDLRVDSHNLPDTSIKKPVVLHEASSEQSGTLPDVVNATPTKTRGPGDTCVINMDNACETDENPPQNDTITSVPLLSNSASDSTPLVSLLSHINPSDSSSTHPCGVMQSRHNPFSETNKTEPNESLGPSALESSPSSNRSPPETPITQAVLSGPAEVQPDSITPCTSSESPSALVSTHRDNAPSDSHENDSNPPTTTIQSTTEPDCEESLTAKPVTDLSISKPVSVEHRASCSVPPSPKDVKDEFSASISHVSSDFLHTESSLPNASALEMSNSDKSLVDIKGGSSSDSVKPYPGDTESSVESVIPAESKSDTSPHHLSEASLPVENNDMDNQCEVSKELKQNKSSALEMSNSSPKHNQKEPDLTLKGYSTEHMPTETCSIFSPADDSDFPPDTSPSEPRTLHTLTQTSVPCELTSTGSVSPTSAATVLCSSPLSDSGSGGLSVSLKHEKVEVITSPKHNVSETSSLPKHTPKDSDKSTADISEESSSDPSPNKPSSEVTTDLTKPSVESTADISEESSSDLSPNKPSEVTTDLTEPSVESEMPAESKSVTSKCELSEASIPVENDNMDNQCEDKKQPEQIDSSAEKEPGDVEATNVINRTTPQESVCPGKPNSQTREKGNSETEVNSPDEAVPLSPQTKLPKSNQSRYHTSTANVISSSNLRDDTKLLLGQISANSQSRGEPPSEFADTDDYKEEEADKQMRMERDSGIRSLRRGHPKSAQEREKLLEKIQSMRKERKVYSRFEMAP